MKLAVNKCYGGFGLSQFAVDWLKAKTGRDKYFYCENTKHRAEPELIELFETYPVEKLNDSYADIKIIKIPDEATDYLIRVEEAEECCGYEEIFYVVDGKIHTA